MFWKKNRQWIVIIVFFLLIAGIYFFGVRKIIMMIGEKKNKMSEKEVIQESQRERLSQLSKLRDDYNLVIQSEGEVPTFLSEGRIVEFFQEIEKIAGDTGVANHDKKVIDPPDIFPGKSKNSSKEKEVDSLAGALPSSDIIQLKINLTGNYSNILNFINKLENEKYLLDILSLEIKSNPDSGKENNRALVSRVSDDQEASEAVVPEKDNLVATLTVVIYTQK